MACDEIVNLLFGDGVEILELVQTLAVLDTQAVGQD